MSALDLDRIRTLANFLESQIGIQQKPAGLVQVNDEEARVAVDALREYVFREMALGNPQAAEWDMMRGFYLRHGMAPKRDPACLVCEQWRPATKVRPRELPRIIVCDLCRAKALTADIQIVTDGHGRALRVLRVDENGDPLSILWSFVGTPKREELIHEPRD